MSSSEQTIFYPFATLFITFATNILHNDLDNWSIFHNMYTESWANALSNNPWMRIESCENNVVIHLTICNFKNHLRHKTFACKSCAIIFLDFILIHNIYIYIYIEHNMQLDILILSFVVNRVCTHFSLAETLRARIPSINISRYELMKSQFTQCACLWSTCTFAAHRSRAI